MFAHYVPQPLDWLLNAGDKVGRNAAGFDNRIETTILARASRDLRTGFFGISDGASTFRRSSGPVRLAMNARAAATVAQLADKARFIGDPAQAFRRPGAPAIRPMTEILSLRTSKPINRVSRGWPICYA